MFVLQEIDVPIPMMHVTNPTKFCRIIEDTPKHFSKIKKTEKEAQSWKMNLFQENYTNGYINTTRKGRGKNHEMP